MNRIKYIAGVVAGAVATLVASVAHGAGTIISLDANFITDSLAYVGDLFTDLNVLIVLAVGLPLAFWVIRKSISLVRAR